MAIAIERAGYATPTALAREAGLTPSVVLRLVGGKSLPSVPTLQRLAPYLGLPEAELVAAAYPNGTGQPPPPAPLPRAIGRLIDAYNSTADQADREQLLQRVDWVVEWAEMRRRLADRTGPG